jgi:hypothetical protein
VKQTIVLYSETQRSLAKLGIDMLPKDSRVIMQPPRRTLDQNAKMHAMLGDIQKQHFIGGSLRSLRYWKAGFMIALGIEMEAVPTIDEDGVFMLQERGTSDLYVNECAQMIEMLYARGAEWGIVWSEPDRWNHPQRSV